MAEPEMGPDVFESLAAKLETLDLTDAEDAAMQRMVRRAARYEPEVEGFGLDVHGLPKGARVGDFLYTGLRSGADLTGFSRRIAAATGAADNPDGWPPT